MTTVCKQVKYDDGSILIAILYLTLWKAKLLQYYLYYTQVHTRTQKDATCCDWSNAVSIQIQYTGTLELQTQLPLSGGETPHKFNVVEIGCVRNIDLKTQGWQSSSISLLGE